MRTLTIGCAMSLMAATTAFAQFEETITVARVLVDIRVTDDRGTPITITGVRPGEKEHEILVSDEECRHTYTRTSEYYAIAPMLPELVRKPASGAATPLLREYSSADEPVGLERTAELLRKNRLMLEQVDLNEGELLR